jgi:hypothetical protein
MRIEPPGGVFARDLAGRIAGRSRRVTREQVDAVVVVRGIPLAGEEGQDRGAISAVLDHDQLRPEAGEVQALQHGKVVAFDVDGEKIELSDPVLVQDPGQRLDRHAFRRPYGAELGHPFGLPVGHEGGDVAAPVGQMRVGRHV